MEYTYIQGLFIGWALGFMAGISFGVFYMTKKTYNKVNERLKEVSKK